MRLMSLARGAGCWLRVLLGCRLGAGGSVLSMCALGLLVRMHGGRAGTCGEKGLGQSFRE